MLQPRVALAALSLALLAASSAQAKKDEDPEAARAEIRAMAERTLGDLYAARPGAKEAIEKAAGHAVFSNFGLKIFMTGSGKGKGVAVDHATKAETFMKMWEAKAGLGFGAKKVRCVFVFQKAKDLQDFVEKGWDGSAQASAAAKAGDGEGGALDGAFAISDGVWVYQMTDKGLALEATLGVTKFYVDDKLQGK